MNPRGLAHRLCFAAALYVPTALVLMHRPHPDRQMWMAFWALCAVAIPASLPRKWLEPLVWANWILLPVTLWWLGYASLNGIGPGWEAAQAAFLTNGDEALEALRTASGTDGFAIAVIVNVVLLTLATILLAGRKKRTSGASSPAWSKGVMLAALIPFSASAVLPAFVPSAPSLFMPTDALASPAGSYLLIARMALDQALYGDLLARPERRPAVESRRITEPMLALLVVGESVRAGGIGPQKAGRGPWSRELDERVRRGLGAWLPTVCAASNGTHMALPLMLTGLPPSELNAAETAPSGLARLKAAGFVTAWISNQDRTAFQEAGHGFYWSQPRGAGYDAAMVPAARLFLGPLLNAAGGQVRPHAALIHMQGSHFEYIERYPPAIFDPEPEGLAPAQLEALRYERSEEYSADVLAQLAQLLDDSPVPAFAVFASDHGENLSIDGNGMTRHLGARTSMHDGTTAALVMWNRAMAESGKASPILRNLTGADRLSYQDVWRVWMALAGLDAAPVAPDADPLIWASPDGRGYRVARCSELKQ